MEHTINYIYVMNPQGRNYLIELDDRKRLIHHCVRGDMGAVAMNTIQLIGPASMYGQLTLYSISNLNCPTASVNWTATPTGNVSFSCTTCNQTTLTKLVDASTITLTATLSGACTSSPYSLSKSFSVDAPNSLTVTYSTSTHTYKGFRIPAVTTLAFNVNYQPSLCQIWYFSLKRTRLVQYRTRIK